LAVTGVGNTVPVLTDAIAPPAPKAPAPPKPPSYAKVISERLIVAQVPSPAAPASAAPAASAPPESAEAKEKELWDRLNRQINAYNAMYRDAARAPRALSPALPPIAPLTRGADALAPMAMRLTKMPKADPQEQSMLRAMVAQYNAGAQVVELRRSGGSLIDALNAMGYQKLSVDELVSLSDAGMTGDEIRGYAQAFGHPSIDELRELRNRDISPTYVERMRAAGLANLTVRDAIRLTDHNVTPEEVSKYIRTTHNAGVDDIIRLHDSGVE
jgi:hypothetical protein